jgi:hypothetical protein
MMDGIRGGDGGFFRNRLRSLPGGRSPLKVRHRTADVLAHHECLSAALAGTTDSRAALTVVCEVFEDTVPARPGGAMRRLESCRLNRWRRSVSGSRIVPWSESS